jgi:FtsZ-interacting cell division protein ZipA
MNLNQILIVYAIILVIILALIGMATYWRLK